METVLTGMKAKAKILKGVNKVANAVKGTLGPNATTVIIQNPTGMPVILNDGVTVARAINDPDPYVQMGIDLLKEVASEAQEKSGDGTTTATLIAQALCNGSLTLIENGVSPIVIRDALGDYLEQTIMLLEKDTTLDFSHADVATIAANNDEVLGDMIAGVLERTGSEGTITIEKSPNSETFTEQTNGLEVLSGYTHKVMINSPKSRCILEKPLVVVTTERIETFNALIPALEIAVKENKPIAIFCTDFNHQALQNLLVNIAQGKISALLVKPSGMPDEQQAWLEDIALTTGSHLFKTSFGESITKLKVKDLGTCDTIQSSATTTIISSSVIEGMAEHIEKLTSFKEEATNDWMIQYYQNRISRLTNGICKIYVGGKSEVEQLERKERVDDAVNACRLAIQSGVVAGGGSSLHINSKLIQPSYVDEDNHILTLYQTALSAPITTIIQNAGNDTGVVPIHKYGQYVCGKTTDVRNAFEDGVIDPVQVTINSLESAVSVAALLLMTDVAILTESL
tara:strand:- start:447 stop:1985 length:1539 start_codon:yes stop_codon:yes gene_type:complete